MYTGGSILVRCECSNCTRIHYFRFVLENVLYRRRCCTARCKGGANTLQYWWWGNRKTLCLRSRRNRRFLLKQPCRISSARKEKFPARNYITTVLVTLRRCSADNLSAQSNLVGCVRPRTKRTSWGDNRWCFMENTNTLPVLSNHKYSRGAQSATSQFYRTLENYHSQLEWKYICQVNDVGRIRLKMCLVNWSILVHIQVCRHHTANAHVMWDAVQYWSLLEVPVPLRTSSSMQ